MRNQEKKKNITEKLSNFRATVKKDIQGIKENTKIIFSTMFKDKVDISMLAIAVIFSILDLVTKWDLTGFIPLLSVFVLGALMRKAIWKYKYFTKDDEVNNQQN